MKPLSRIIVSFVIISILLSGVALPREAKASACANVSIVVVSTSFVCAITNIFPLNFTSADWIYKWIVNPAVRVVIRSLLQATTQQIVGWIQGNGGKNVGYVKNLDQALRQEADIAGGEFLNNLAGINLCGNISAYLRITLRTPPLAQRLACSVTDIVQNVNNFYQNFANGGWPAFVKISLEPQNNPYGAYLIALDAKLEAESKARERVSLGVATGKGFLGFRVPVGKNCDTRPASGANPTGGSGTQGGRIGYKFSSEEQIASVVRSGSLGFAAIVPPEQSGVPQRTPKEQKAIDQFRANEGRQSAIQEQIIQSAAQKRQQQEQQNQLGAAAAREETRNNSALQRSQSNEAQGREVFCETEYEVKTPGTLIADTLSKATNSGIDFAISAKDFDEAIATIINALIQKMITSTFSSGSSDNGGSTVSGQGIFDPGLSQIKLTNDENAEIFVSQANDLLYSADATLVAIHDALGTAYQAAFTTRAAIANASSSNDIDPILIQQLATEEARITQLHINAQDTLAIKGDLIRFKDSLVSAGDPKTISGLAMKLPQFGSRLAQIIADAGVSSRPAVTTRDFRQDTVQLAQGSVDTINSTLRLVDLMVNQVSVVASTTPSTTKQIALLVARARLLTAGIGLRATMTQLTLQKQNITQAPTQNEVNRLAEILVTTIMNTVPLIQDTMGRVRTADEVLKQ